MSTFFYFAYGSNMLTQRLQARCPSARPVSAARALRFSTAISKKGADSSGKATLAPASNETPRHTFGVVFEIPQNERELLDSAEGPGYFRNDAFNVSLVDNNQQYSTSTYVAGDDHIALNLEPYCWYRALIIAGAEQHNLPDEHVAGLRALPFRSDPDLHRTSRKQAVKILEAAGFGHLLP